MRFLSEDKFILTIERSLVEIPIVGNFVTSRSDITNISNKNKKYDANLIYYTLLPKNAENFKTFINRKLSKNS